MGVLGTEQRRFNVAMSRAQSGRITVAHHNVIVNKAKGKYSDSGPWNAFYNEARASKTIIDGGLLNKVLPSERPQSRIKEVYETYRKATPEKQVAHANVMQGKSTETAVVVRSWRKKAYEQTAFMEETGADLKVAEEFLRKAKGDLPGAINAFFPKHGSVLIEEEIVG